MKFKKKTCPPLSPLPLLSPRTLSLSSSQSPAAEAEKRGFTSRVRSGVSPLTSLPPTELDNGVVVAGRGAPKPKLDRSERSVFGVGQPPPQLGRFRFSQISQMMMTREIWVSLGSTKLTDGLGLRPENK
ncbi:hypothetical protein CRG98_007676 [Punica granatum]|uniref:Uncharacterized protein n=1 Tax=Punica granatum TaxID=22663 RepID=A0A2I0KTX0_PUNGR|nr:hypothetical protein CRG98_007676 [Punica granatum]